MTHTRDAANFKRINTLRLHARTDSPLDYNGNKTVRMVGVRTSRPKVTQSDFSRLC